MFHILKTKKTVSRAALTAVLAGSMFAAPVTSAAIYKKGFVASTGSVDGDDAAKVEFKGARALISKSVSSGDVTLRYDLDLETSQWLNIRNVEMYIRFRDTGAQDRVTARLRALNILDGNVQTVMTFDSNATDAEDGFRLAVERLNGSGNVVAEIRPFLIYFVEVSMDKLSSQGNPGLESISVFFDE